MNGRLKDDSALLEELRIKAERFDLAMSVANDGMYDWDVASGSIYFDSRYYTMAGYGAYEFPGTFEEWAKRVQPDDYKRVDVAVKAYLSGEIQEYDEEFRFRRKAGDWMWIRARVKIVERDAKGAALRVIGTHSDITQRKRAEEDRTALESQLRQAQKMEAVGRLAGGVAHDFNNVLSVIIGNSDLALTELPSGHPVSRYLEEISQAAERAAQVTGKLLALSRKQVIEPKVIDLAELIGGLNAMLTRLIGDHITVRTVSAASVGQVCVDPGQIEQVLLNLIINARDAMPDGGDVCIEIVDESICEADLQDHAGAIPGDYVTLSVTDTGIGMDADTQAKLFEPFFTTKEMGKGTGLGLSTVFGIVDQHGGRIEVNSEPGEGACFKLYFPRVHGAVETLARPETPQPVGGRETVLVVEDEETVRNVAIRILEKLGYEVLVAGCGADALALAERHEGPIDLLLTDVIMPRMNGRQLAKALSKLRPSVEVLYTSGYSDEVIAHRGLLDDGIQFVAKPYSIQLLASRIREVLDNA